jgi:hypothetical protein
VAVIGIVDEVKKEPEPSEKAAEKKPKPAKPSTSSNARTYKELSKAEIEELQKRGDMEMFASVLGKFCKSGIILKFTLIHFNLL